MFFIVSTGRSGTTTIARTLSLIDGCTCLHEPPPQLIIESSAYRYGTVSGDEIKGILRSSRKTRMKGDVYGESNQTLSLIIPLLAEVFPKAKFIWLLRNGMDVVASAYQKQWYTGHTQQHQRYEDCPPVQKAWVDGRVDGDRCGEMTSEEWNALDRIEKCSWYWSYINRTIEADLQEYAPDRYTTVRLEDFDTELPRLVEWLSFRCALVPSVKRHNTAKSDPLRWPDWNETQVKTFEHWCGDLMDRYYPEWRTEDGEWHDIPYTNRSGLLAYLGKQDGLVRRANSLLKPNKKKGDERWAKGEKERVVNNPGKALGNPKKKGKGKKQKAKAVEV